MTKRKDGRRLAAKNRTGARSSYVDYVASYVASNPSSFLSTNFTPWAVFYPLCLSFLICKMGVVLTGLL